MNRLIIELDTYSVIVENKGILIFVCIIQTSLRNAIFNFNGTFIILLVRELLTLHCDSVVIIRHGCKTSGKLLSHFCLALVNITLFMASLKSKMCELTEWTGVETAYAPYVLNSLHFSEGSPSIIISTRKLVLRSNISEIRTYRRQYFVIAILKPFIF